MTIATTLAALILGGWVVPGADQPANQPTAAMPRVSVPQAENPEPDSPRREASNVPRDPARLTSPGALPGYAARAPELGADGSLQRPAEGASLPGLGSRSARGFAADPSQSANYSQTQYYRQTQMPAAPTDPMLGAPSSPWAPPTAQRRTQLPSFGTRTQQPYSYGGSRGPGRLANATTSGSARLYFDNAGGAQTREEALAAQADRMATVGAAASAPALGGAVVSKPFAGASPTHRPAVSPYALLGNNFYDADVDVYNQVVAPSVAQHSANQQVGNQVRGLRGSISRQSNELRQFGQEAGLTTRQQYFNNHGGYYSN